MAAVDVKKLGALALDTLAVVQSVIGSVMKAVRGEMTPDVARAAMKNLVAHLSDTDASIDEALQKRFGDKEKP